jgi:hypothetical protein
LGAAAALVAGWQSERTQTGYGGSTGFQALEDTASPETTGTDAFEGTAIEGTGKAESSNLKEPTEEASFVHRATDENSRGDYTYLGDPSIDGDPNAVVLVTVSADREGNGEAAYGHNVGVWYDSADQERWAIFNQDRTSVPSGTTFRVVLPPSSESFVHRAVLDNTVENATYLNNPLISGKADAPVSVTQSWNPGAGRGLQRPPRGGPLRRGRAEVGYLQPGRRADARGSGLQRRRLWGRRKHEVARQRTVTRWHNFSELRTGEVPRTPLPRARVSRASAEG